MSNGMQNLYNNLYNLDNALINGQGMINGDIVARSMGVYPAIGGVGSSVGAINRAKEEGRNPVGSLPWGTIGGAGVGAILAALFNKLNGIPFNPMSLINGGMMGMGLGGTIDAIRNSW